MTLLFSLSLSVQFIYSEANTRRINIVEQAFGAGSPVSGTRDSEREIPQGGREREEYIYRERGRYR